LFISTQCARTVPSALAELLVCYIIWRFSVCIRTSLQSQALGVCPLD